MARIEGEIVINRSVDEVFDFVADERNEPRYNPRMLSSEKLSPGPVGLGSQFRAVMQSRPRLAEMTIEFTGYQRPRRLASTSVRRGDHLDRPQARSGRTTSPLVRWPLIGSQHEDPRRFA